MGPSTADKGLKPYLWFTLYRLLEFGAGSRQVKVSTTKLSNLLGGSQQSASRHLQLLERMGLVTRKIEVDGSRIMITEEGMKALKQVYYGLMRRFEEVETEPLVFEGVVFSGLYQGGYYIRQGNYREQIREKLGFNPYPGTLNLKLNDAHIEKRHALEHLPSIIIEGFADSERAFGSAKCYHAILNGEVEAALIVADRTTYDLSVMEIISPVYLRERLGLEDGDVVRVSFPNPRRSYP